MGNYPGGNSPGGNSSGGNPPGGSLLGGNIPGGNYPGGIVLESCLVASALLRHRLDNNGEVIQGYLIFDSVQCSARHYWFRSERKDYDIGTIINARLNIGCPPSILSRTAPTQDCDKYVSAIDQKELKALEEGYLLYLTKSKTFWKIYRSNWLKTLIFK